MAFVKEKGECLCERCWHWWKTKPFQGKFIEPRSCAGCKSKVWNKPRVYGGKYLDGLAPMAQRWKPTGRAAAAMRPERIKAEKLQALKSELKTAEYEYKRAKDDLSNPDFHKIDRQAAAYFFKEFGEIVKRIKAEIAEIEN